MAAARPRWRDAWQLPALAGAAILLTVGGAYAFKTKPKHDVGPDFVKAAGQVESGAYATALETLNKDLLPHVGGPLVTMDQVRDFHLLRARAIYLGQRELGLDREDNNKAIVSEYERAEELHASMGPSDRVYLAGALVSLGELDKATELVETLGLEEREQKVELVKRMIERSLNRSSRNVTRAMDLLAMLTEIPGVDANVKLWAITRQMNLSVEAGDADAAVTRGVRALVGIDESRAERDPLAGAFVALAKAYLKTNDLERCAAQLDHAHGLVGDEHALTPTISLLRAEIERGGSGEQLSEARERYAMVVTRFPYSDDVPRALLGMAEIDAKLSQERPELAKTSLETYTRLVDMLVEDASKSEVSVGEVEASLLARHRDSTMQGDHAAALAFVEQAERLTGVEKAGPDVLLALAESHRAVAEAMLRAAAKDGSAISVAEADPETQREAREHLLEAGEYFRRHAEAMVQKDTDAYGESLWWSADAFDRAGDLGATVAAFQQFTTDFPSDRRHAEATYRLAQAFQARGDAELATKLYRGLIEARDLAGAGSFTDASYVPLAQTLMMDGDATNDAEAQQLLMAVVTGAAGGTETGVFREALGELAASLYRAGEHERAIERFEEYLQRYGATESLPVMSYRLADSYRLSAAAIAVDLAKEDRPEGEKRDLESKRVDRLRRATEIFERVRGEFEGTQRRTALEDLYLRNAYFYRADCLFDLREFDDSIRAYDGARERYSKDAASLVAMIQIVNALVSQGELQKAATANARAKRFFESLPESVWDDPTLPMTRRDWERWLDSQVKLGPLASVTSAQDSADAGTVEQGE